VAQPVGREYRHRPNKLLVLEIEQGGLSMSQTGGEDLQCIVMVGMLAQKVEFGHEAAGQHRAALQTHVGTVARPALKPLKSTDPPKLYIVKFAHVVPR
jgi:hypothetical protein